ncbi:MAG: hypothetical protein ACJ8LG_20415 [Massilia sp.]
MARQKILSGRYASPMLAVDSVTAAGESDIEFRRGRRTLRLSVQGERAAALADLERLRQPWPGTRWLQSLSPLLDDLDKQGWIVERVDTPAHQEAPAAAVAARLSDALDRLGLDGRRELLARIRDAGNGRVSMQAAVVRALLEQLRRESPGAVRMLTNALQGKAAPRIGRRDQAWPADAADVETALATIVFWALHGLDRAAPPPQAPRMSSRLRLTGDIAIRETEAALRDWEAALGAPGMISHPWQPTAARRVSQGIHLQQYYVSLKYVESVLPVVQASSSPPLRRLAWRYLQEELGHEHYEMDACLSLGLSRADVLRNVPLPAFAAFPRVMTSTAAASRYAWVLALPLAEGLPYERKPLPSFMASQGLADARLAAHVDEDQSLDHGWMARRFAACLGPSSGADWNAAMDRVAVMYALTRAGWDQLGEHFGQARGAVVVDSPWTWMETRLGL